MDDNSWKIEPEYKKKIEAELADFILEQGEKALRHTIDIADKTTNRAFTIVLILLPIISTVIALLVNAMKSPDKYQTLDICFFSILLFMCSLSLFYLVKLVFPRFFMTFGREPKDIIVREMLENDLSPEKKLLAFKFNEIKNCQSKIDYNKCQNSKRILVLSRILKLLGLSAIIAIVLYLMILYLLESA